MLEYSESDLKLHNDAFHDHTEEEVNPNEGKINDWHTRHEDKHLEIYPTGHVGMIASSFSQKNVLPKLTDWLKERS